MIPRWTKGISSRRKNEEKEVEGRRKKHEMLSGGGISYNIQILYKWRNNITAINVHFNRKKKRKARNAIRKKE